MKTRNKNSKQGVQMQDSLMSSKLSSLNGAGNLPFSTSSISLEKGSGGGGGGGGGGGCCCCCCCCFGGGSATQEKF